MDLVNKKIFLAVTNDLATDQRMHRICTSLAGAGAEVCLVGRKTPWMIPHPALPFRTVRLGVAVHKGFLFYALFNFQLFFYLLFRELDVIVSNDLDTLPACRMAALFRRKVLVYDTHELFTEVPELINRKLVRSIWLGLEKVFLPGVRSCYTVNPSLAAYYHEKYGVPMKVIRNLPFLKIPIREEIRPFPGSAGKKIILYQGSVNLGRGLELVIDAMAFLPESVLLIIGTGDVLEQLKALERNRQLEKRVLFAGRVPPTELYPITLQASVGLSVEEPAGLNYYFASPNKLYDYIQARVPVLCSPFPEMQSLVDAWAIGQVLRERSPEALARQLQEMIEDDNLRVQWQRGLEAAARELCWEKEQVKLFDFFRQIQ
jgi:glycosyltransferase involved in cell wall biosynthesis